MSDKNGQTSAATAAELFLLKLSALEIEHIYMNAGTDFAPLIEAYCRLEEAGEKALPKPIIAAHENLVMGMAHGAYLVSGKPQAVMFHVGVGTANAICGALNAANENVPILIMAGRTPVLEGGMLGARDTRVAWAQEMYDQAGLVREAVKWDYELRLAEQTETILERAVDIAMCEPRGPVYLTLPREVLAQAVSPQIVDVTPRITVGTAGPDENLIEQLADRIEQAEFPLISSRASGQDQATVSALSDLCDQFGIGYVDEQTRYLNLPFTHEMHLGHDLKGVLEKADLFIALENDVPWVEDLCSPNDDCFIVHCGQDPLFSRIPIRNHRADMKIRGKAKSILSSLRTAMEQRSANDDRKTRIRTLAKEIRGRVENARQQVSLQTGPIDYACLSHAVSNLLHDRCRLFNEYWAAPQFLKVEQPGSYFFLPTTGGLGWALPSAIGAKHADPTATCIATIGDGTYMFSNPAACHHASAKHDLPVLTVVCNNSKWNAVDMTTLLSYPNGHLAERGSIHLSDLSPTPRYQNYVEASGGYGVTVSKRSELPAALEKALHVVEREGRQALVDVICQS